jgi:formate dehydrogenase subunit gamma
MTAAGRVLRFSVAERVVHWMTAISFLYAALTGLALWSPSLFWLSNVFGGGDAVRRWHPWGGVVFAIALGLMFRNWSKDMKLDSDDRRWLRRAHRYAVHDENGLPPAGRFNAGQKVLFWTQSVSVLLLFASGIVLYWPELMPRGLRLAALVVHPPTAIVSIAGIILHIYMGTAAVPGALRGMIEGWVPEAWARAHHPRWYREIVKR